jgi:hypothetical protein
MVAEPNVPGKRAHDQRGVRGCDRGHHVAAARACRLAAKHRVGELAKEAVAARAAQLALSLNQARQGLAAAVNLPAVPHVQQLLREALLASARARQQAAHVERALARGGGLLARGAAQQHYGGRHLQHVLAPDHPVARLLAAAGRPC